MTRSFYEADEYRVLQSDVDELVETAGQLYLHTDKRTADFLEYDQNGSLAHLRSETGRLRERLIELSRSLKIYGEQMDQALAARERDMDSTESVDYPFPVFGAAVLAPIAETYSQYKSYCFMQSGKSFSADYSDLNGFMSSDLFKTTVDLKVGLSEVSNLGLMGQYFTGNTSAYSDELLKLSLQSVLDGLPDADLSSPSFMAEAKAALASVTGIENIDAWLDELGTLMEKAAAAGESKNTFFTSQEYMDWLSKAGGSQSIAHEFLTSFVSEDTWGGISDVLEKGGTLKSGLEWLDVMTGSLSHCLTDYSLQVSYLDAMQDMMLNSGYHSGDLNRILDDLRKEYDSDVVNAVRKIGKQVGKEAIKGGVKAVGSQIPLIKDVNLGLGVLSTGAKAAWGSDISAAKTLMGLSQYDSALTASYERYLSMAREGIATESDMRELDRVFTLLASTKKTEYENMMALSEGTALYGTYASKLKELEKLLSSGSWPGSSGGGHSSGGGRHG